MFTCTTETEKESPRDAFKLLKTLLKEHHTRTEKLGMTCPSLIDMSIGNPDLPPDPFWRQRLCSHITTDSYHGYAEFRPEINKSLRTAFVDYYHRRFQPKGSPHLLNIESNIIDLLGSKEAIFFSLFASLQPGDVVLIPDPSYSVYQSCAQLVGAKVEFFLCDAHGQPDFNSIRSEQLVGARMLVICSPCNPTGISLSEQKTNEVVAFAQAHDLTLVIDRAYAEIVYDEMPVGTLLPGSVLTVPGAIERTIELHSLSKSCSISGWRVGFVVGAEKIINNIKSLKFNVDFGSFLPVQLTVTEMLPQLEIISAQNSQLYAQRMRYFVESMQHLGWHITPSTGTFFVWARLPQNSNIQCDLDFVRQLLYATGILVAPGSGFGPAGTGYVRIAMVHDISILEEAVARMSTWLLDIQSQKY